MNPVTKGERQTITCHAPAATGDPAQQRRLKMAYEKYLRCGLETVGPATDGAFDGCCVCSRPLFSSTLPEPDSVDRADAERNRLAAQVTAMREALLAIRPGDAASIYVTYETKWLRGVIDEALAVSDQKKGSE